MYENFTILKSSTPIVSSSMTLQLNNTGANVLALVSTTTLHSGFQVWSMSFTLNSVFTTPTVIVSNCTVTTTTTTSGTTSTGGSTSGTMGGSSTTAAAETTSGNANGEKKEGIESNFDRRNALESGDYALGCFSFVVNDFMLK